MFQTCHMTLIGQSSDGFTDCYGGRQNWEKDSIACTLQETASMFVTSPMIAAATAA